MEYHREYCWVELEPDRREVMAKPRGRLQLSESEFARQIAVGDEVNVAEPEAGHFTIEEIFPRRTWLMRKNLMRYRHKPQCVVANADQLAVVVAPNPRIKLNVVDRFFLAAIQGGLETVLVVNKIDLDPALTDNLAIRNYSDLGYRVFFTAATRGEGLKPLAKELHGKLTAFCGHSGVGKSTILRKLTGVDIKVAEVHPGTQKGRQTTSAARLYHLKEGGMVVDTPGIREFGLAHLNWLDVHDYFTDIAAFAMKCSFRDCRHAVEPGCRVRLAVEQGELSGSRLKSFIKLCNECTD